MMRSTLFLMIIFAGQALQAQSAFSAEPTLVEAVKDNSYFVFYDYSQLYNHTGDSLLMRWVKVEERRILPGGHGQGDEWATAIQDPDNYYYPAGSLDSADFYLPPVAEATDKFILQLFPNGVAGRLVAKFRFFPVHDPVDSLTVTFDYQVNRATAAADGPAWQAKNPAVVFPNPFREQFTLSFREGRPLQTARLLLYDGLGRQVHVQRLGTGENPVEVGGLPPGMYYYVVEEGGVLVMQGRGAKQ